MGNSRGQAAIEAALAIPLLSIGFALVLYLSYHGLVYFYASYNLEEALICATQENQRPLCERGLQRRIRSVLIFNENAQISLSVGRDLVSGRVEIPLYERIRMEKTLRRSLEKNL